MSAFDVAQKIYRESRLVIEATRDLAAVHSELRWAREDLEDLLLDLKLAVLDLDQQRLADHLEESSALLAEIKRLIRQIPDDE